MKYMRTNSPMPTLRPYTQRIEDMTARPAFEAMIPLRSWGLKRGDEGLKCCSTASYSSHSACRMEPEIHTFVPCGYTGEPRAFLAK